MKWTMPTAVTLAIAASTWGGWNLDLRAQVDGNDNNISIVDDCLPGDPAWEPTGGCGLRRQQGDVPFAEFGALLRSPLTNPPMGFLIGHPSWRNEPSHVTTTARRTVLVTNRGGRGHTFTEVANFGGGFIQDLNIGLSPAPECQAQTLALPPGAVDRINNLSTGLHKFQCCIHPWMRATIRIE